MSPPPTTFPHPFDCIFNGHPHPFHVYRLISLQNNVTPLHHAAVNGHTAVCELLMTKGANVNALANVSDCGMVNGGEKERGARRAIDV